MLGRLTGLILALTLLCATGAQAETATGAVEVQLAGKAAKPLRGKLVATNPGTATRRKLVLPALTATFARGTATLTHAGVLQVRGRNLVGVRTLLGRTSRTTAVLDGKRRTLLAYRGRARLDPDAGTAHLTAARATLPKRTAKALGLKRGGKLGVADVRVKVQSDVAPVLPDAAPGQRIVWRPRESFVRYMNSESGRFEVAGGAQAGPAEVRPGTDAPLTYSWIFPEGKGTLAARWIERGINISWTDPQVPADHRTMSVIVNGQTRLDFLALDPDKATAHTTQGNTETYENIPATLTPEGSASFAGFYAAGDEFGTVTVSTTTAARRSATIAVRRKPQRKAPPRVVALSPFTANTLVDLGVKPVAIANTLGGQDRFRPQLKSVKRLELSHPNGPNLEQLASLDPDIVLSSPTWNRGHAAMRRLGMKVKLLDPGAVAQAPAMTRRIAKAVGRAKRGRKLARAQARDIAAARRAPTTSPRVLVVLGVGRSPHAFLPDSWGGDLILQSGGDLITEGMVSDGGFARISDEEIVLADPEIIIAVPHGNAKDIPSIAQYLGNNPAWQNTDAARNGRVYVARGNSLLQPFTDVGRMIRDMQTLFLKNRTR